MSEGGGISFLAVAHLRCACGAHCRVELTGWATSKQLDATAIQHAHHAHGWVDESCPACVRHRALVRRHGLAPFPVERATTLGN